MYPPLSAKGFLAKWLSVKGVEGGGDPFNGQNPLSSFWKLPLVLPLFIIVLYLVFFSFLTWYHPPPRHQPDLIWSWQSASFSHSWLKMIHGCSCDHIKLVVCCCLTPARPRGDQTAAAIILYCCVTPGRGDRTICLNTMVAGKLWKEKTVEP